jgi:hypothetical protein
MKQTKKAQLPPMTSTTQAATGRRVVAVSGAVTLVNVPAVWPAGVSALSLALNACQGRDVKLDWPLQAANKNVSAKAIGD